MRPAGPFLDRGHAGLSVGSSARSRAARGASGEPAARVSTSIRNVRPGTTPIVTAEVLAHKRPGRAATNDPLAQMESGAPFEPLARGDAIAGVEEYARLRSAGHPNVSLADALIHATARRIGAVLLTLDGNLKDEPGVVVCRRSIDAKEGWGFSEADVEEVGRQVKRSLAKRYEGPA